MIDTEHDLSAIRRQLEAQQRQLDDIHGWLAQLMGAVQHNPFLSKFLTGGGNR